MGLVGPFLFGLLFWTLLLVVVWSRIGPTLNGPIDSKDEIESAHDADRLTEPEGLRAGAENARFTIRR